MDDGTPVYRPRLDRAPGSWGEETLARAEESLDTAWVLEQIQESFDTRAS